MGGGMSMSRKSNKQIETSSTTARDYNNGEDGMFNQNNRSRSSNLNNTGQERVLETENSSRPPLSIRKNDLNIEAESPRIEEKQFLPYTPNSEDAQVYKYFCPLCMQYYIKILKCSSCSNYICSFCCNDYFETKGIVSYTNNFIGKSFEKLAQDEKDAIEKISCPHCQMNKFMPEFVLSEEKVRDYSIEYGSSGIDYSSYRASPVRIGETFEDLKRKMIPFQVTKSIPIDQMAPGNPIGIGMIDNSPIKVEPDVDPSIEDIHQEPVDYLSSNQGVARRFDFDSLVYNHSDSNNSVSSHYATSFVDGIVSNAMTNIQSNQVTTI